MQDPRWDWRDPASHFYLGGRDNFTHSLYGSPGSFLKQKKIIKWNANQGNQDVEQRMKNAVLSHSKRKTAFLQFAWCIPTISKKNTHCRTT